MRYPCSRYREFNVLYMTEMNILIFLIVRVRTRNHIHRKKFCNFHKLIFCSLRIEIYSRWVADLKHSQTDPIMIPIDFQNYINIVLFCFVLKADTLGSDNCCNEFLVTRARGYKTFFVLSSVEHEILNVYKYKNRRKFSTY